MAEGMIIFTLWYIALAYNYYKENFLKDHNNEESSAQEDDSPMQEETSQNELDETEKPAIIEKQKSVESELKLAEEDKNDPIESLFQEIPTEEIKKSIHTIKSDIQAMVEEPPAVEDLAYQIEAAADEVGEFMQEEITED